ARGPEERRLTRSPLPPARPPRIPPEVSPKASRQLEGRTRMAAMMQGALEDISKAVGNTPIVRLHRVTGGVPVEIYVKCEYLNPGGSHKDRLAANLLRRAEEAGLKPGGTIVEATSGNTGASLALFAAVRAYKCIFVMPDKMSQEKILNLRAFGAKVVVC